MKLFYMDLILILFFTIKDIMYVVKVSGVLGFVLSVARIMGICPIRLKHSENGYDSSFSYATALYGYFTMTLANLLAVIGFTLEVIYNNKFSTAKILNITITIIICTFFLYNGIAKTKSMLKHLAILNKINNKLNYSIKKPRLLKKKHLAFCLLYFIFNFALLLLTFITSVLTAENLPDYIYPNLQIFLLETLMITLNYKLYEAFKNIRRELENHLRLMKFDQPTEVLIQICTVRKIANAYFSVCKVKDEMNEKDGPFYIIIITSIVFYTVFATCDVIYRMTSDNNTLTIVYDFLWILSFIIHLYIIIEPCHHISEEAGKIQVILSKLICHTTDIGKPCSWEWDLILNQLYLLETTFTPLRILTLDRTLLTSIISVATTYLVIAIPHTKTLYKNITFI